MVNLALQPAVVEFFDTLFHAENAQLAVQEVPLAPTSRLIGKTIVIAQNMLKHGMLILAIKKPSGLVTASRMETYVEQGDVVIVVGTPDQLATFAQTNGILQDKKD